MVGSGKRNHWRTRRPVAEKWSLAIASDKSRVLRVWMTRSGLFRLEMATHCAKSLVTPDDWRSGPAERCPRAAKFCQLTFYRLRHLRAMSASGVSRITGNPDRARRGEGAKVRSDEIRCCAAVCDHQYFRRPGWHIDSRAVETLADLDAWLRLQRAASRTFYPLSGNVTRRRPERGNRLRAAVSKISRTPRQLRQYRGFHQRWAAASTEPRLDIPQYAPASPASAIFVEKKLPSRREYTDDRRDGTRNLLTTRTPRWVSTSTGSSVCAEWNVSIF